MRTARQIKIDIVLTKSISRFARNTVDLLATVHHLKEIGVEVRFEKEHINSFFGDSELMMTIVASFAQEEVRSASENIKWGIRKRYANGIDAARNKKVCGYRYDGEKYIVQEDEAEIVRYIFQSMADGIAPNVIIKELNARVAQDQTEYEKRYDALVQRFDTVRAKLDETQVEITKKQAQRQMMENFMEVLRSLQEQVEVFDEGTWYAPCDYITVYGKNDIRVTFRNGKGKILLSAKKIRRSSLPRYVLL